MRTVMMVTDDTSYVARARRALCGVGYLAMASDDTEEAVQLIKVMDDIGLVLVDASFGLDAASAMAEGGWLESGVLGPPVMLLSDKRQGWDVEWVRDHGLVGIWSKLESDDALVTCVVNVLEPVSSFDARFVLSSPPAPIVTFPTVWSKDKDWFESRLIAEWGHSRQAGTAVALMLVRVDGGARAKEEIGEKAMAEILGTAEVVARAVVSSRDTVGRNDADTIGIVLAESGIERALSTRDRLLRLLEATEFGGASGEAAVSFSCGIAVQDPAHRRRWKDMRKEALEELECTGSMESEHKTSAVDAA